TSSNRPSLNATSTSANYNWDTLELWLDSVTVDTTPPSSCVNEQFVNNMHINNSAASPSTPNAMSFFQFSKHAPAPASLDDFATIDFSDEMFTSDIAMTTPSSAASSSSSHSSTCDGSGATLTFLHELQKSADFLSMDVSASGIQPTQTHTPKRYITATTPSQQAACAKKTRGRATPAIPVPVEARLQVRKVKQRGYERTYRGRLRNKRARDEALWMQLEAQLRAMLAEKQAVHAHETHSATTTTATNGLELRCFEMAHQLRALQEENAFWVAVDRWIGALNMWGGETEASRSIRFQINALPKLSGFPTLTNFTWD
ncbi:hypothetical protein Gpo141_00014524, partial [Globisporangium polare]